jgi:phospho-N-acetylmuramoyl-pentapeptide-transferase
MLYVLLYPLRSYLSAINLLTYISFRAAMAALTAFLFGVMAGPAVITFMRRKKIGERTDKSDSPRLVDLHEDKRNTPTMGGLIILGGVALSVLLWGKLGSFYLQAIMGAFLSLGTVGLIDDYIKLTSPRKPGIARRTKLLCQIAIGLVVGGALYLHYAPERSGRYRLEALPGDLARGGVLYNLDSETWPPKKVPLPPVRMSHGRSLYFPFFKEWELPLGVLFVLFVALVITAASNAVNLTDGLDGLAIGNVISVTLVYFAICYIVGRVDYSRYLFLPYVPGAGEVCIFCAAMLGASLSFLWFNCHPAQIFMGDTGALPLGGGIGVVAIISKQELLLLLAGGIFVVEAVSVILQVLSFRFRGKRIFRCAPVHHHYQFLGWREPKIIVRFWIIAVILALVALATLKIR